MGKKNVVWNDYISKNERFADFINGVVFHGEQLVRPEALTALDTKLRRRERERDSYHEFGFLKRQGNKADLMRYVEKNEVFRHLQEDAFDVLSSYGESAKLELNKEDYRTKEGLDMCTALRELEEDARREGFATGMKKGSRLMNELNRRLIQDGRMEDLFRSIQDTEYQKELMEEYGMEG